MKRSLTIAFALTALLAVTASAAITVYKNPFAHRGQFSEMKKLMGGKDCKKSWRGKESLGFKLRGSQTCALKTPVEGDTKRSNQIIESLVKISNTTDKSARDNAYVGLTLRASKKSGYELRVYPKRRDWKILKNGEKVKAGNSKAINPVGKKNTLSLETSGRRVTARANKRDLGRFKDQSPDEVKGRKTGVTFGGRGKSKGRVKGFFDNLKVQVPEP